MAPTAMVDTLEPMPTAAAPKGPVITAPMAPRTPAAMTPGDVFNGCWEMESQCQMSSLRILNEGEEFLTRVSGALEKVSTIFGPLAVAIPEVMSTASIRDVNHSLK